MSRRALPRQMWFTCRSRRAIFRSATFGGAATALWLRTGAAADAKMRLLTTTAPMTKCRICRMRSCSYSLDLTVQACLITCTHFLTYHA
jgi:hypothetical protein